MNKKQRQLAELLGLPQDFRLDWYESCRNLLSQGIRFSFYQNYSVTNKETLLASFFNQHKEFYLMNQNKTILEVFPKIPLWVDDILVFKAFSLDTKKEILSLEFKLEDLDKQHLFKMFSNQEEFNFTNQAYQGTLSLKSSSDTRNFNELFEYTPEQTLTKLCLNIKQSIILKHTELITFGNNEADDLSLLIHRLELWGYDFSKENYTHRSFNQHLEKIQINDLGFKDMLALEYFKNNIFVSKYNKDLISDTKKYEIKVKRELRQKIKALKARKKL